MKEGWERKRLGDLCRIKTGKKDVNQGNPDGKFPFFTCAAEHTFSDSFSFDTEALLIAGNGDVGKVSYYKGKFEAYQRTYVLYDFAEVMPRFLFLILDGKLKDTVSKQKLGNTMPYIKVGMLTDFQLPVPPLAEQQRIVGILDEAFAGLATAKANAEKNLQNARALFESHLQSVFSQRGEGWVEKRLSEIAKHSLGKMLDKAKNKGEPQPYLRNINVRWFTFDLSDLLQMPFLPTEAEKYTAIKGDVLICEGGYPGRAAIWDEDYPIYFQKALHRVRFHQPELNKWFVYYLSVQDSSGQLKKHFSGTGIQHFTGETLARFQIPVPPVPELRRAVAKFDALSEETQRLTAIYTRKLAALEELKKALLHQAFSGEL
jgi:type I restriction enzyme S subunit